MMNPFRVTLDDFLEEVSEINCEETKVEVSCSEIEQQPSLLQQCPTCNTLLRSDMYAVCPICGKTL